MTTFERGWKGGAGEWVHGHLGEGAGLKMTTPCKKFRLERKLATLKVVPKEQKP